MHRLGLTTLRAGNLIEQRAQLNCDGAAGG
jgi:hypothetical protein